METTAPTDSDRRQKKLAQVQALLERAEQTPFSEEADACRKKADELMLSYSISEWEASQRPGHESIAPIKITIKVCDANNPLKEPITDLFGAVLRHTRCRAVYYGLREKTAGVTAVVFGFPADIEYMQMLFMSLRVQMDAAMKPKPDPNLPFIDNLVMLKETGMKWADIWPLLAPDKPWHRPTVVKWGQMYTDHCKETGRPRNYSQPMTYQRNYADGFQLEVDRRMAEIRRQRENETSTGMELVLVDKVDQAMREEFPNLKPVKSQRSKYDHAALNRGREVGKNADLGQTRVTPRKELG